jgi:hypothetical protein
MFETMNDRRVRLTAVDLLKSFLLSHVGTDEEKLNEEWRQMLAELTIDREDTTAPTRFKGCFYLLDMPVWATEKTTTVSRQISTSGFGGVIPFWGSPGRSDTFNSWQVCSIRRSSTVLVWRASRPPYRLFRNSMAWLRRLATL